MEFFCGCLLGVFVGDAVGATLEGRSFTPSHLEILTALELPGGGVHRLAPGQITDDSELTIACGRGIINAYKNASEELIEFPLHYIALEYVKWFRSHPFDIGNTCRAALTYTTKVNTMAKPKKTVADSLRNSSQLKNAESKSNGSLMRCSVIAIWGHKLPISQLGECAYSDSLLTHVHPSCCEAVGCYVISCAHLFNNCRDYQGAIQVACEWLKSKNEHSEVQQWIEEAKNGILLNATQQIGYVKIAFVLAYYHLSHQTDFIAAIKHTIAQGGDTDTNAAIVGGLLGAFHGEQAIPENVKMKVLSCDTTKGRPRPSEFLVDQFDDMIRQLVELAPSSVMNFPWVVGKPFNLADYKK